MGDTIRQLTRRCVRKITTPTSLIALALILLVLGIYGAFGWKTGRPSLKPDEPLFLILVAGATIAGILFTAAAKFHSDAVRRAFALVSAFRKDTELVSAFSNISAFFRLNEKLDIDDLNKLFNSQGKNEIKLWKDISIIGNFLEDMAISIIYMEVNEEILEEFFGGVLIRFYLNMIENNIFTFARNNPPIANSPFGNTRRPKIFINVDTLYYRWKKRYERSIYMLHEDFLFYPFFPDEL